MALEKESLNHNNSHFKDVAAKQVITASFGC
jgi:hypothetical protein